MLKAPLAFNGTLQELFTGYIEPNLPSCAEVEHLHTSILNYCRQPNPVFVVRYVRGVERGIAYTTASGNRIKPSDNAPAWWMHFVAFNGIRDVDLGQMPTHMFEIGRCLPTQISAAGWHVAHILNAKDRNTDWINWSRAELVRRFIRNVHPCNAFYVPKPQWRRYGGDPGVISFFASVYAKRYASVWEEFLEVAGGVQPPPVAPVRYVSAAVSGSSPSHRNAADGDTTASPDATVSYRYSRLCFKAKVIEPLAMHDTFEVVTLEGTFRMTKAEFYRDFANVVRSKSYLVGGIYHYRSPPLVALKFLTP
jgi:hypothetical protein